MNIYTEKLPVKLVGRVGTTTWQAPSNIALVKYWGKYPGQMPCNPSLSMTLSKAFTTTTVKWEVLPAPLEDISLTFHFVENDKSKDGDDERFSKRVGEFLRKMSETFPFLVQLKLEITTNNTFPYGAGIASSASAYAALALCLVSIEDELLKSVPASDFFKKASYCARIGSGSAARSLFGHYVAWGNNSLIYEASNSFAAPFDEIDPLFIDLCDTILIVSSKEKEVGSSHGHQLMENNPFAQKRFMQAKENFDSLVTALSQGDWDRFCEVVEEEALSLHAMMMTSRPGYLLLKPETLSIIEKIKVFRKESQTKLTYTMDAGPNVHLLYPESEKTAVHNFVKKELLPFLEDGHYIDDQIGNGPTK